MHYFLKPLCPDPVVQQSFLDSLLTGVEVQENRLEPTLTLVLTLRADFVAPAAHLGVVFEPGLVKRILNDVGAEPGNLPLLEFSLTQLWDGQQKGELSHQVHELPAAWLGLWLATPSWYTASWMRRGESVRVGCSCSWSVLVRAGLIPAASG